MTITFACSCMQIIGLRHRFASPINHATVLSDIGQKADSYTGSVTKLLLRKYESGHCALQSVWQNIFASFFFVLFHWVPCRETSQRLITASVA